jgi:hypothetical protein
MGKRAKAEADYFTDAKSEDARRIKVLDAVSNDMKVWSQANFGATPQEEEAHRMRLFNYYSQQLGLPSLGGGVTTSSGVTIPQGVKITKG